ncbi:MAG: hypothetical protein GX088_08315 [Clostridia bacterium]|nr:hypothetical protein [Clostridia bacterium]
MAESRRVGIQCNVIVQRRVSGGVEGGIKIVKSGGKYLVSGREGEIMFVGE